MEVHSIKGNQCHVRLLKNHLFLSKHQRSAVERTDSDTCMWKPIFLHKRKTTPGTNSRFGLLWATALHYHRVNQIKL